MAWSLEQGLVSRSTNDWIDSRYRAYRAGDVSEAAMCGEMVQMYAGLRDSELEAAAARYVDDFVRGRVFAEMAALVKKIQQARIEIWAVSSTNRWVIVEGLRDFGIPKERILAADVRVADGIITSEIVDVPTDEAKAAALKRVMNSLRKSRFLARRSRNANIPARNRVSLADFRRRRRPPTNPLVALKSRVFDWFRAAPLLERIVRVSSQT